MKKALFILSLSFAFIASTQASDIIEASESHDILKTIQTLKTDFAGIDSLLDQSRATVYDLITYAQQACHYQLDASIPTDLQERFLVNMQTINNGSLGLSELWEEEACDISKATITVLPKIFVNPEQSFLVPRFVELELGDCNLNTLDEAKNARCKLDEAFVFLNLQSAHIHAINTCLTSYSAVSSARDSYDTAQFEILKNLGLMEELASLSMHGSKNDAMRVCYEEEFLILKDCVTRLSQFHSLSTLLPITEDDQWQTASIADRERARSAHKLLNSLSK